MNRRVASIRIEPGQPQPPATEPEQSIAIDLRTAAAERLELPSLFDLLDLPSADCRAIDTSPLARSRIKTGHYVLRTNDQLHSLYLIIAGTFKTEVTDLQGNQQVLGFATRGALMGIDALGSGRHTASVIALEDSSYVAVPADRLLQWMQLSAAHERRVLHLLTEELRQRSAHIALIGTLRAPARLARFFLQLSQQQHTLGYSATELRLRMSRGDIASYLGLKLETVSRLLSRLQQRGLLQVRGRYVHLLRIDLLQQMESGSSTAGDHSFAEQATHRVEAMGASAAGAYWSRVRW